MESGAIFAIKEKSEVHPKHRERERRRKGFGRRRGTAKARAGRTWERKVRSQRLLLDKLREAGKLDTKTFRRYYLLIKGNAFPDKKSLLLHLGDEGIRVSDEELKGIEDRIRAMHG